MTRKQLALIDGHALAFRAFHALKEQAFRSSRGEPTYAVYGFAQILLTMLQEQKPAYLAVSFDVGRTFRDDLYAEYKAGRGETPEEFHPQLDRIKQLVGLLNIPIYTAEGFEADDVIGTLARQATAAGVDTLILTGDTDTLQLVDDHVRVLLANPYGGRATTTIYDEERVRERYKGLGPHQLADLRGLKGDTSDNIPGVKGIGETGAIQLLSQFGSVEALYATLDQVPNRYRKHLEGQQDQALFSKRLATIVCDAPVSLDLAAAAIGGYDRAAVIRLFQELEIGASSNLIKKLPGGEGEAAPPPAAAPTRAAPQPPPAGAYAQQDLFAAPLPASLPAAAPAGPAQLSLFGDEPAAPAAPPPPPITALGDYRAITDVAGLEDLLAELRAAPGFAFDSETDSLSPLQGQLVGLSFATRPGAAAYLPLGHREGPQLDREQTLELLRPLFGDPARPKYAHNAKFDIEALGAAGVEVRGLAFDTMVAAALLGKRPGLKDLAFYELQLAEPMTAIEELIGRGSKQVTFDQVPIERATPYAAADADMTLRLVLALGPQLDAVPALRQIFDRLEMPLVDVLVGMERAGIGLDRPYLSELNERLTARIGALEGEIHAAAGGPFNINSTDQLSDVLFGKLGLPTDGIERTAKTKKYSLTAEALEKLRAADSSGLVERVLQYRQLGKLKSTYADSLPTLVNPRTGRVHTSYNQVGAATGRLSSVDPNLQNIPIRTQEGKEIRRAFVAAPGHCFVAADYSQIELRVLAHYTQDPELLRVFREGLDIHAATAAQLFNVPIDEVTKNQRRDAKCVAAGTLVLTEHGILSIEQLGIADEDAVAPIGCSLAQESSRRALATGFYNGGVKPTIRITTAHGYVLEATANHQVRSIDGAGNYVWRRLGDLSVDDYAALARGAMAFGQDQPFHITYQRRHDRRLAVPEHMTPAFARFLGYYVAEGNSIYHRTSSTLVISNADPEILADLHRLSLEVFGAPPHASVDRNGVTSLRWHCSRLVELVDRLGVGVGAAGKRIPDAILQASYASQMEFLRAFFEGDGSISSSFISAASKSEGLIRQLQSMLLNLGIVTHLEQRDVPDHGRHYKLRVIGREGRELFARHIGFVSSRKRQRLESLLSRRVTFEAITLPHQAERLRRLYPQTRGELRETIHTCIRTLSRPVSLTYRRLASILEQLPAREDADIRALHEHLDRNVFYDRVVSIEFGSSQVYDLVVPETNTYVANGFVSHNTTVFGIVYGISAFGLSQRLGMERSYAQGLIDGIFRQFPGLKRYIEETLQQGRASGYVSTLFGRRRQMGDLSATGPRRAAAEREAINAPIQGTAADIMKIAMINVARAIAEGGLRARLLLQVHDELIVEAPEDETEAVAALLREVMGQAYPDLSVPLEVGVEVGTSWGEMRALS